MGQRIFPVGGGECVWGVLIQPACGGTNIDYSVFGVSGIFRWAGGYVGV